MAKTRDDNWKVESRSRIRVRHAMTEYLIGEVVTPLGYVCVYADDDITSMGFIHQGREYTRNIERPRPTERGLAILAGKFAREVAADEGGR